MILIVHLSLDLVTLLDFSDHLGGFICMHTEFLAIRLFDKIICGLNTE
jgi:hypothetical protein